MKRSRFGSLGLALLWASLFASCASGRAELPSKSGPLPYVPEGELVAARTLGSGDVIEIRVVGEPALTGDHRIASDGAFVFPFCGKVDARGTTNALAERLTRCLSEGYLKKPQVTVFLKEHNSQKVFVFGEVSKPGTFPFEERMSVVQAITLAGGFTRQASKNAVLVTRTVGDKEHRIRVGVDDIGTGKKANFFLLPGDIVYVSESFF